MIKRNIADMERDDETPDEPDSGSGPGAGVGAGYTGDLRSSFGSENDDETDTDDSDDESTFEGAEVSEAKDSDTDDDERKDVNELLQDGDGKFVWQDGDVCQYCKKGVDTGDCPKSKISMDGEFKTIYFCDYRCFEKFDYWPMPTSKKSKGKVKRKSNRGMKAGPKHQQKKRRTK